MLNSLKNVFYKVNQFQRERKWKFFSLNKINPSKENIDTKTVTNEKSSLFLQLCLHGSFIELPNEKKETMLLFNKVRNDKKHRKRAFQKRGYWKKMHYFIRKNNRMCFAFKVQNINYENLKKLKRGEIYSL